MADFNNKPQLGTPQEYIDRSRGTSGYKPNNTFGSLFEGIGTITGAYVNDVDRQNLNDIEKKLYDGIDPIRDSQGVGDAASNPDSVLPTTSTNQAPPGVNNATSGMDKLTQAYQAGKISETSYWAKVEALTRQIRSQYPGYREVIDKKVAAIVGTTPANALRASIMNDLETNQRRAQSEANSLESFERQNMDWIVQVEPTYFQRKAQGQPFSKEYIMNAVAQAKAQVLEVENNNKFLAYEEKKGTLNENVVAEKATDNANVFINSFIQQGMRQTLSNGMTVEDALAMVRRTGKPLDEKLQIELNTKIEQLYNDGRAAIRRHFNEVDSGTGRSIASYMRGDTSKLDKIVENSLAPIAAIRDNLYAGNYAIVDQFGKLSKLQNDRRINAIINSGEAVANMAALGAMPGGNAILGVMQTADPAFLGQAAKDITSMNVVPLITGNKTVDEVIDATKKYSQDPTVMKTTLQKIGIAFNAKEIPDENFVKMANSIFSSDFLSRTKAKDTRLVADLFNRFTSPEVQSRMERIKGSNPEVYRKYVQWVASNAGHVFSTQFSNLAQGIESTPYIDIQFDKKTNQFSYKITEEGKRNLERNGTFGVGSYIQGQINDAVKGIDTINSVIRNIEPIIKKNGGDVSMALNGLFKDIGINTNSPKKKETIPGKLHKAIIETQDRIRSQDNETPDAKALRKQEDKGSHANKPSDYFNGGTPTGVILPSSKPNNSQFDSGDTEIEALRVQQQIDEAFSNFNK